MKTKKLGILVECSILLSIAFVLSTYVKFNGIWPNGGSVTLCGMLPIIVVSYRRGINWGLLTAFCYSLLQLLFGFRGLAGMSIPSTVALIALDYVLAFTVLGLGGMFRGRFKKPGLELAAGSAVVIFLRFVCHFVSGYIFFGEWAEWFFSQPNFALGADILGRFSGKALALVYSLVYNASYLSIELVITCIVSFFIAKFIIKSKTQLAA